MVSFGVQGDGPQNVAGQSFLVNKGAELDAPVHYLDTATMQDAGGLTWSTSTEGVAKARQAVQLEGRELQLYLAHHDVGSHAI